MSANIADEKATGSSAVAVADCLCSRGSSGDACGGDGGGDRLRYLPVSGGDACGDDGGGDIGGACGCGRGELPTIRLKNTG